VAQHPARECSKRSLAIFTKQRLNQPGPRISRTFGQPFFTNRQIAKPAVALLVEHPVPTKAAPNWRRSRQWLALFAPLLLGADPVGGVAEFADLVDDRGIDRAIELIAPELFVDSDLRQLVAQLYIPTQLPFVGDVTYQVAA